MAVNIVAHVGAGLLGAANAWSSNQILGAGRIDAAKHGLTDSKGVAFQIGQKVGDALSIVSGGSEIAAGGAGEIASFGIATPIAAVAVGHGATSVGLGVYNLLNGKIVYSTSSDVDNSSTTSTNSPDDFFNGTPNHPEYTPPKNWDGKKVRNPNGKGSGYPDKKGDVWIPQNHKGTHGNHWDVQMKKGKYRTVYPKK